MGGRQSRVQTKSGSSEPEAGDFTVSVTPGLLNSLASGDGAAPSSSSANGTQGAAHPSPSPKEAEGQAYGERDVQQAYQEGLADARRELRHHLVTQKEQWNKELVEREKHTAEVLSKMVKEFEARRFKPPQAPLQCEEQAKEVVKCYRESEDALKCRSFAELYQECANKVIQGINVTQ